MLFRSDRRARRGRRLGAARGAPLLAGLEAIPVVAAGLEPVDFHMNGMGEFRPRDRRAGPDDRAETVVRRHFPGDLDRLHRHAASFAERLRHDPRPDHDAVGPGIAGRDAEVEGIALEDRLRDRSPREWKGEEAAGEGEDGAAIEAAASRLIGAHDQVPPAYSAVKVGGRKLYEAARAGEALEAPARPIVVHDFAVTRVTGDDVDVATRVSSGTYVRVLAADLGRDLGCGAHLARLVRTRIGPFRLEDASPPESPRLLPVFAAVAHLPRLDLDGDEARAASHGSILAPAGIEGPYAVVGPGDALIGIWRDDGAKARPEVVLPVT